MVLDPLEAALNQHRRCSFVARSLLVDLIYRQGRVNHTQDPLSATAKPKPAENVSKCINKAMSVKIQFT
jgi:hypothetical protein